MAQCNYQLCQIGFNLGQSQVCIKAAASSLLFSYIMSMGRSCETTAGE